MPHAESGVNGSGNDRLDRLQETSLRITRWLALLAVGAVLAGAALTVTDVVLRSATRQGVFGANDAVLLVLVVAVTACFPLGMATREHMRLAALGRALGGRAGHYLLEILSGLVTLAVMAGFAWQFARRAGNLAATNDHSQLLQWPLAPWWYAAAALMGLAALAQALVVAADARALATGAPIPETDEQ